MNIETLQSFLGWCTFFNSGLLLVWLLSFWLAHDWIYRSHCKLCKLSVETFDSIHYSGMAYYKISIFMLNLAPYLALHVIQ